MAYKNFKVETDADGIALVTWDIPGRSMNVLDETSTNELDAIVKETTSDAAVKGVVITSAKEAFCAGADLSMLEGMNQAYAKVFKEQGETAANQMLFEQSRRFSLVLRSIETSGKPWAAAINGLALGGGFEITLCCHYRVAAENPKTRLGLPEVKVGLFPGAGGTQRVPRLVPPQDAMTILLKGDPVTIEKAKQLNLIHAIVPAADLIKAAKDWIKGGGKAVAPWDEKGFKLPGGPVFSKAGMMMFPAGNAIYRRETYDNYPAARAIMSCVYEGLQLPIDAALRVELRYFTSVLRSKEAAAMIRSLFLSMQELNKGARRPKDVAPTKVKKIAVIGAGFMGASVGYVSARAGLDVILIDRDQESADKGKAHAQKVIEDQIKKGRAKPTDAEALLARITPTADYAALKDVDLVIEAVFEDRKVKAETFAKAQEHLRPEVVFASNTSTLPITSLAEILQGPGQVRRHPFLLAGREDDAGRDHQGQEHRRSRAGDGARLRPADRQDADRGQRQPRLLRQPLRRPLRRRRQRDVPGRRAAGDDRELRQDGRHAGRPALAVRRSRARSRPQDHEGDRSRSRP